MREYINYSAMSAFQHHVFQTTGECSAEFHMGESEFNQMVDDMIAKQAAQDCEDASDNLS